MRSDKSGAKRDPPQPDRLLVGKRINSDYVYLLKKLFKEGKHGEIHVSGVGEHGNSKVIWIANRMVAWGYCSITRIRTIVPQTLEVSLKKTDNFDKCCEEFEEAKAEKRAAREAQKEKEAAAKAVEEKPQSETASEQEAAKVALESVEKVVEAFQ